jgi:hypothetical protein
MGTLSIVTVTGVLLIAALAVGGAITALLTQKVVVDQEGHVTEIELPVLGRLKTNYPLNRCLGPGPRTGLCGFAQNDA